jgi:hypothetical protein
MSASITISAPLISFVIVGSLPSTFRGLWRIRIAENQKGARKPLLRIAGSRAAL